MAPSLKALLGRGWVKAQNFQRSDHKLRYLYVLTPQGVRQRMQLTRSFLARKEREYEMLTNQIYLLTSRGASAKLRLAHDFLARKEHEFERLQREIAALHSELKVKHTDA